MNELKIFANSEFGQIRTIIDEDNDPWFVGKDISEILGYKQTANMKKILDDRDYKEINPQNVENTGFIQNGIILEPNKNIKRMLVINESGLYQAIFGSTLDKSREFKRWVTSEVLPAIRKHGAYMTDGVIERTLTDPDYLIMLATNLKEERAKRALAEAEIQRNKSKVLFAETVSASSRSCLMGELAKMISQEAVRQGRIEGKIGQNKLFAWMRNNGYLCKSGERKNQPLQQYVEQGLFEMKKGSYVDSKGANVLTTTTKVTGKGQIYFINKFLG